MDAPTPQSLAATEVLDADHPLIRSFALQHAVGHNPVEQAKALYLAVRDGFRYDPYRIDLSASGMRASTVLTQGYGWCVNKAGLLAAVCRAAGIAARLGYADVRNHLSTERLNRLIQTDLFIWHGYTELWLGGRWVKATPAFNIELCERFGLHPLEFDGQNDSIYHPYDRAGNRHMEYMRERGVFDDMPLDQINRDFLAHYPGLLAAQAGMGRDTFDRDVAAAVSARDVADS